MTPQEQAAAQLQELRTAAAVQLTSEEEAALRELASWWGPETIHALAGLLRRLRVGGGR